MLLIRSLLFTLGSVISTLFIATTAIATIVLPYRYRYAYICQWRIFNLWWLKKTCGVHYEIEGLENIPALGPAIIFCKHQSTWETLALARIFPPHVWVLKRELLWLPFFGWAIAMLEPIAIDRGAGRKALKQIIHQGKQRLAAGRWVVVFPEGTRVPMGQEKKFGIGGAILAESSGVQVVPVAHNAGHYWPKRGFIKRPGTIKVVIGPVIPSKGRKAVNINADAEDWINKTVKRIST
jgi:1-acyl-sn-glycerol-3-phosphate acyltransferase